VSTHKFKEFTVENEPVLPYTKGTKERKDLEAALADYSNNCVEVPIVIGGKEYKTDRVMYQPMVSDITAITGKQPMKCLILCLLQTSINFVHVAPRSPKESCKILLCHS